MIPNIKQKNNPVRYFRPSIINKFILMHYRAEAQKNWFEVLSKSQIGF
jgi:hypothetical protein